MNFQAAMLFVQSHCKLLGQKFYIPEIKAKGIINELIIAPSGKCLDVLNMLSATELDNKTILGRLKIDVLKEEFLIYVIGKDIQDRLFPMTYDVYLKTQKI